jgi:hypothetical protein
MLAAWTEILPVFIVRWLSRSRCERISFANETFCLARPDVLFWMKDET